MEDLYIRKPRGFPEEVSSDILEKYFSFRFSYLCLDCRKRMTPPSIRFLGRKVYVSAAIIMACKAIELGHAVSLEEIRRLISKYIPKITARRWVAWWRQAVWNSSFWREWQGKLCGYIQRNHFLCGVWNHFQEIKHNVVEDPVVEIIQRVLQFFSPITMPQNYPS